jgi:uncharacterized phiE125 gp8 family phage protein
VPNPLDALADVKQALGVTGTDDDDLLEQLQEMADIYIERHCGRNFLGGSFTEYHAAGQRLLFLTNYPVAEVTSVKVDPDGDFGAETLRDPDSYSLHADRGVIQSQSGTFGSPAPNAVQVVYETAEDAVPPPVARAYIDLIGHWYRQVKTNVELGQLNVLSRNESDIETRYAAANATVPAAIVQTLALYRVPAV